MRRELTARAAPGRNLLQLSVQPLSDGAPCGVYARGQVSRYTVVSSDQRLAGGATEASVTLEGPWKHEAGTLLRARQWATNQAGLASVVESPQRIVVDDTPPVHAHPVHHCMVGGRYQPALGGMSEQDALRLRFPSDRDGYVARPAQVPSPLAPDGGGFVYSQSSEGALRLCWPTASGFTDDESGVWYLEWQLARWTGLAWDTVTATQQLSHNDSSAAAREGAYELTKAQVERIPAHTPHPRHTKVQRASLQPPSSLPPALSNSSAAPHVSPSYPLPARTARLNPTRLSLLVAPAPLSRACPPPSLDRSWPRSPASTS